MPNPLLKFSSKGIFCERGNFFIDPWHPVENAVITHAHSDHAKYGHKHYIAHHHSIPILKQRLGKVETVGKKYNEGFSKNGVKVSFHPAGHIIGSAQVRVEYKGEVWCVSGDYKTDPDPVAEDFEPVKCHSFITECTFGLPIYQWPEERLVIGKIEEWWRMNQENGKVSLISAYALGKAQRILSIIDSSIGPIYCHGAVDTVNKIHQDLGFLSGEYPYLSSDITKKSTEGALIVAPPSAVGSPWSRKLGPRSVGFASGWMMLRGSKRRENVDRGFILSDHADWRGLNEAVKATEAEQVICMHGYSETFSEWLNYNGYNAISEKKAFEDESINGEES